MASDNLQTAIERGSNGAARVATPAPSNLGEAYKLAKTFASSQLVPKHLQGKTDDCFIALLMAEQLGCSPIMVMQNIIVVSGTAGWKASFVIARANACGPFEGPIEFRTEGKGDGMSVTAYAKVKATGREVERTVTMAMAKAAGWSRNEKYQQMPEQMLSYRAACFLVRLYCPEVMLGMQSDDELVDAMPRGAHSIVSSASAGAQSVAGLLNATGEAPREDAEIVDPTPEELAKENAQ